MNKREKRVEAHITRTKRIMSYLKKTLNPERSIHDLICRMEKSFLPIELTLFLLAMRNPFDVK